VDVQAAGGGVDVAAGCDVREHSRLQPPGRSLAQRGEDVCGVGPAEGAGGDLLQHRVHPQLVVAADRGEVQPALQAVGQPGLAVAAGNGQRSGHGPTVGHPYRAVALVLLAAQVRVQRRRVLGELGQAAARGPRRSVAGDLPDDDEHVADHGGLRVPLLVGQQAGGLTGHVQQPGR
jgi:hypothetical protein